MLSKCMSLLRYPIDEYGLVGIEATLTTGTILQENANAMFQFSFISLVWTHEMKHNLISDERVTGQTTCLRHVDCRTLSRTIC